MSSKKTPTVAASEPVVAGFAPSVTVGGQEIATWPEGLDVVRLSDEPTILMTWFEDTEAYQERLVARILELENDPNFSHRMPIGGSKIRDVHRWGIPEADLIHQRATAFVAQAVGREKVTMDLGWGNVSRKGEYLSPHSHDVSLISVVYCVTAGDRDLNNGGDPESVDGRLAMVDPRIPYCCDRQPNCVTRELWPDMRPGAMVLFPSELVHFVHPYWGETPRITIAWNFSL